MWRGWVRGGLGGWGGGRRLELTVPAGEERSNSARLFCPSEGEGRVGVGRGVGARGEVLGRLSIG